MICAVYKYTFIHSFIQQFGFYVEKLNLTKVSILHNFECFDTSLLLLFGVCILECISFI